MDQSEVIRKVVKKLFDSAKTLDEFYKFNMYVRTLEVIFREAQTNEIKKQKEFFDAIYALNERGPEGSSLLECEGERC